MPRSASSPARTAFGRLNSTREGKLQEHMIRGWLLDRQRSMKRQCPECTYRNTNPSGPASAGLFFAQARRPFEPWRNRARREALIIDPSGRVPYLVDDACVNAEARPLVIDTSLPVWAGVDASPVWRARLDAFDLVEIRYVTSDMVRSSRKQRVVAAPEAVTPRARKCVYRRI